MASLLYDLINKQHKRSHVRGVSPSSALLAHPAYLYVLPEPHPLWGEIKISVSPYVYKCGHLCMYKGAVCSCVQECPSMCACACVRAAACMLVCKCASMLKMLCPCLHVCMFACASACVVVHACCNMWQATCTCAIAHHDVSYSGVIAVLRLSCPNCAF